MRKRENEIIRVLEWKPQDKRPSGRPRKRQIDVLEEDLKILGVENWRDSSRQRQVAKCSNSGKNSLRVEMPVEEETFNNINTTKNITIILKTERGHFQPTVYVEGKCKIIQY